MKHKSYQDKGLHQASVVTYLKHFYPVKSSGMYKNMHRKVIFNRKLPYKLVSLFVANIFYPISA